mgnify:CR=1 FL=1
MKNIRIFDTTLRDGLQTPSINISDKNWVKLAILLEDLGVDIIEAGFPISSKKSFNNMEKISKKIKKSIICGLARHEIKDIDAVNNASKNAKRRRLHLFIPTSKIHLKYKLECSYSDVKKKIIQNLSYAKNFFSDIEWSSEDATRTDKKFLADCLSLAIENGATTINIADTVGYIYPNDLENLINYLKKNVYNFNKVIFSVHCHNDLGMATMNSLKAIENGATQVECTLNGIGERAGNASLQEIVMNLKIRSKNFKKKTNIKFKNLFKTSVFLSNAIGIDIGKTDPIIGENAFTHESGIHQHGIIKNKKTYEIITPELIGRKSGILTLGVNSGMHGLKYHLKKNKIKVKNLSKFYKFFKLKSANLKIVDKFMLFKIFNEYKK